MDAATAYALQVTQLLVLEEQTCHLPELFLWCTAGKESTYIVSCLTSHRYARLGRTGQSSGSAALFVWLRESNSGKSIDRQSATYAEGSWPRLMPDSTDLVRCCSVQVCRTVTGLTGLHFSHLKVVHVVWELRPCRMTSVLRGSRSHRLTLGFTLITTRYYGGNAVQLLLLF